MKIHGLQKMTLLDYPGKVACTVFLAGCNFRCPYCHNSELIDASSEPLMDDTKLLDFLGTRQGMLDGVCFTGGEPMLRPDLPDLLVRVKELGFQIKIDTNGCSPDKIREIAGKNLADYIAMDIKNSKERYAGTVGLENFDISPVEESVKLLKSGITDYEFRTTVVDEFFDEESFYKIGEWIEGAKRYFIQPFVDRDTVKFAGLSAPSEEKCAKYAGIMREFVPATEIRGM